MREDCLELLGPSQNSTRQFISEFRGVGSANDVGAGGKNAGTVYA